MWKKWIFLSSDAICNLFLRVGGELNPEGNGYQDRDSRVYNNSYIENLLSFKKIDTVAIEAGHSPHVEAPLEFNTILLKFIQKVF